MRWLRDCVRKVVRWAIADELAALRAEIDSVRPRYRSRAEVRASLEATMRQQTAVDVAMDDVVVIYDRSRPEPSAALLEQSRLDLHARIAEAKARGRDALDEVRARHRDQKEVPREPRLADDKSPPGSAAGSEEQPRQGSDDAQPRPSSPGNPEEGEASRGEPGDE